MLNRYERIAAKGQLRKSRRFRSALLVLVALSAAGCSTLASRSNTGVIVARSAQIRSSTAVVAADLLEVNRGEVVDILDFVDVPDREDNRKTERWFRVRAHDADKTEGWIEARNIMLDNVLQNSRKLADEDKGVSGQATGQLRASSNLRLSPDRGTSENIMMRLDSGSSFEILGWKRVPRPVGAETTDTDVAPKPGTVQQAQPNLRAPRDENNQEAQETNELWYKVRLSPSISPAPEGWIYGKQVELTVPSDIIYYRRGREFVGWKRLDEDTNEDSARGKDVGRESKPGSWVILEKSASKEGHKPDEPDFDRIYVLGYDKRDQDHYTAYLSGDVKGYLPLRVEGRGSNKTFIVRVEEGGQIKDQQYSLYRDDHGVMRVLVSGETREKKGK